MRTRILTILLLAKGICNEEKISRIHVFIRSYALIGSDNKKDQPTQINNRRREGERERKIIWHSICNHRIDAVNRGRKCMKDGAARPVVVFNRTKIVISALNPPQRANDETIHTMRN